MLLVHLRQVLSVSTHVKLQGANTAQVGPLVLTSKLEATTPLKLMNPSAIHGHRYQTSARD